MITRMLFCAGLLFLPFAASAQTALPAPKLSSQEAIQLFEAGGFHLSGGKLLNRCGRASNPRVAFIDLNSDGHPEAHLADVDPGCYGKPGAYFAILARNPQGKWVRLIGEDGIVSFGHTRSEGWVDLVLKEQYSSQPGPRHFNGTNYVNPVAAAEGSAPRAAAHAGGGVKPQILADDPAANAATVAQLSPAERAAIFKAAGAKPVGKDHWRICTDDPNGTDATIEYVRDLNGDGRPEALVTEGGTYCYGNTGEAFNLESRLPDGRWKVLIFDQGIPQLVASKGVDGFPDIEIGMPGFCFPIVRWNGREYAGLTQVDENGKACKP